MNDVNTYIKPAEEKMEMAVEYLDETLAHIRAGKANPNSRRCQSGLLRKRCAGFQCGKHLSARRTHNRDYPVGEINV